MTRRIDCTLTDREVAELRSALQSREGEWDDFDYGTHELGNDDWHTNGGAWSRKALASLKRKLLG